jgi:GTPase SAR1 family protein
MRISNQDTNCDMILVMGVTGSGKSNFINQLAKGAVVEGHGVTSGEFTTSHHDCKISSLQVVETRDCEVVRVGIGRREVALVDTPGFDDTNRSDAEILQQIVEFLCAQYELGISLKGIIYMHRITDNKMSGSALRYFEMFMRLCGERNLENVILLTTMWSELKDPAKGMERERELRKDFWSTMEKRGSTIRQFDGSRSMAEALVCRLMRKQGIVLDIQEELVDQEKRLDETRAGQLVVPRIDSEIVESEQKIREFNKGHTSGDTRNIAEMKALERRRGSLLEQRQRLQSKPGAVVAEKIKSQRKRDRMMSKLTIFGSILGLAVTVTVNAILPLAGVT